MENKIPKLYETDEVPLEKKVIHQVYAIPSIGFYWLIAELDEKENIAFGFANLNDEMNAEWGYIPIDEVVENGGELVEDWEPCEYPEARKLVEERLANGGRVEMRCAFCNYAIKDPKATPREKLTRRDTASFEFNGKRICGDDHDMLAEYLESE